MDSILMIKGSVNYKITLDAGVFIFDDRKEDLTTFFKQSVKKPDELEEYTKAASQHWDREIREGAILPPTLKTEKKYEKQRLLTGTFGIPLNPFLMNAQIQPHAEEVQFVTATGIVTMTIEEANDAILGFSKDGKPLKEDGPIHVYYGDGSNENDPIKNVREIFIK
ncbi:peptidyl-prolyl cis-trans isomerase [Metabacillus herbersteinensis]|uniref:Peptidyl-prolyl cis-trans isomerase n=1 Tax=Metabacillus herbersteinensis TaxID=283816 RepID=A0ABV6GLW5_9BACI